MSLTEIYAILSATVSVYEIVARVVPTSKNWSIISNIVNILDLIVKNKALGDQKFAVTKVEDSKSKKSV